MGFTKAKLKVEDGGSFDVQFNPSEYSLNDTANYSEEDVKDNYNPVREYINSETTLSLTLYFDTYEPPSLLKSSEGGSDVTKYTKKIVDLTNVKGSLHRPPLVTFSWGKINFTGVVTDVKQDYTMFLSSGMPVRAKLDITIKSVYDNNKNKRKSPFESPDRTKFRTIHEGEQLWHFANVEYGSPEMWRAIAKENNIMNPLDITPGQVIKLPAL